MDEVAARSAAPDAQALEIVEPGPDSHPRLALTLARAFRDDPVFCWMLPHAPSREDRLRRLFVGMLGIEPKYGLIAGARDGLSTALWRPPGKALTPTIEMIVHAPTLLAVFGMNVGRALAASNAIETHLPKGGGFLYAHMVAVDPAVQGQGRGSAMVRMGVERARGEGVPVYLETAKPDNVRFYQGLGFQVLGDWRIPRGPRMWSMLHPAGS
jgi:ribosomal protein S18 acetylase RimI-like enzyme